MESSGSKSSFSNLFISFYPLFLLDRLPPKRDMSHTRYYQVTLGGDMQSQLKPMGIKLAITERERLKKTG